MIRKSILLDECRVSIREIRYVPLIRVLATVCSLTQPRWLTRQPRFIASRCSIVQLWAEPTLNHYPRRTIYRRISLWRAFARHGRVQSQRAETWAFEWNFRQLMRLLVRIVDFNKTDRTFNMQSAPVD